MLPKALVRLAAALAVCSLAAPSAAAEVFRVGLYGGAGRDTLCVNADEGTVFEYSAWVQVPNDRGLRYVTLRLDLPVQCDFTTRPVFHDLVTDVIFTDFADGTTEWNALFTDCPSGWIRIYTQQVAVLEGGFSLIELVGDRSLARDCDFVLNGVEVANELAVNDPSCEVVAVSGTAWGCFKARYR
jgi:hypothetical protein